MVQSILKRSRHLLNGENKNILSAAAIIAISYLLSALLGVIRNRLLAGQFFGGNEGSLDVYFAASVIPDGIFQLLIVGSLSAAFMPIYQDYLKVSEKEANHLTNTAMTMLGLLLALFTLLVIIFAVPLAQLITHFGVQQTLLLADLMRIMAISQIFFTISAFLTGVLQAHRRFLLPALAPVLYNLGTIIGIITLSSRFGIYSAAIGMVIGSILHFLIQLPTAVSLGFTPKLSFSFRHRGVVSMFRLMPARSAALGVAQFERFIATNLSSLLVSGSLAMFTFARQLYLLPISLFGVALGQASFPSLSKEAALSDQQAFRQTLRKSLLQTLFFAIPASVLVLILRIPLVRLSFGADNFPWEATLLTGKTLALLSLSIAPQATTHILVRAFYAHKDTKTPLLISLITITLFTLLGFVLVTILHLGLPGLSLALTISNSIDFLLLYYFILKKTGSLVLEKRLLKYLAAGLTTGICLWIPMRLLDRFVFDTTHTLPLILLTTIVSIIGVGVYVLVCFIFKIEELRDALALIKRLGNWRQILSSSSDVIDTQTQN